MPDPINRRTLIKTGTRFSGLMKNMMGALSGGTNRYFHFGSGKGSGWYDDAKFLSQCIADVNLVRQPELCILDVTKIRKQVRYWLIRLQVSCMGSSNRHVNTDVRITHQVRTLWTDDIF